MLLGMSIHGMEAGAHKLHIHPPLALLDASFLPSSAVT